MEKKPYSPAAVRSMAVTASAILLTAVVAVVITVLSGANQSSVVPPVDSESASNTEPDKRPGVKPPAQTDDVIGDPQDPPRVDPTVPTVSEITWCMPVEGATLSKTHDMTKQVFSQTMMDYRVHCGVDLQTALGADVMSVADGVIENIYEDPFQGTCIRIAHADGYVSYYKNLAPSTVETLKEGDAVRGGQTLASVGESAIIEISDEAHLHFELYRDGTAIDPMSVLPYDASDASFDE